MASNNELVEFIKRQIRIEEKIVKSLNEGLLNIKNPPVKSVLKGISLDSIKHAELYAAASVLLTKVSPALQQENLDTQIELVEKHIHLEEDLIKKLKKIIPTIQNNKVQFLLNSILSDEKRHHAMLKLILEIIVHGETITEEDWWKLLWENVPFHGAPGG
ncbi:MAG: ferritin-like domain-containing protein [Candidatus Bathyarchaeota archaeon]|jgi:rubrerythrin|nr:ferritin-like domain-containing protein [Candidatus Bathyarchaeota archaeon]